jgi:hypothetical protein
MPAVAMLSVDTCMAGSAKGHEIGSVVGAALRQRLHMVDLLGWCVDTLRKTNLAQWMGSGIAVTDTLPGSAVATLGLGITIIFLVASSFLFGMLFAEATVCKTWAAGIGAGTLGFPWHSFTFLLA